MTTALTLSNAPARQQALDNLHSSSLLSRQRAAEYLGMAPQTLAVWASTGRYGLRFIKVGRIAKYRKSDLDAWLDSRTATQTS